MVRVAEQFPVLMIDSPGEIERKVPKLASKMDATRIGAGGHLIGAYAACALAGMKGAGFGPGNETADFMDPRVDEALLLGPHGRGQELNEKSWEEINKPMWVPGCPAAGPPSRQKKCESVLLRAVPSSHLISFFTLYISQTQLPSTITAIQRHHPIRIAACLPKKSSMPRRVFQLAVAMNRHNMLTELNLGRFRGIFTWRR
jgi:hypothetical protein